MPKIRITENDYTLRIDEEPISNTVYIPCKASGESFELKKPLLFKSASEFTSKYPENKNGNVEAFENRATYNAKVYLLENGIYVLVDLLLTNPAKTIPNRWDLLADKGYYDVRFLTNGDFVDTTYTEVIEGVQTTVYSNSEDIHEMLKCAGSKSRGDCIALLDVPEAYEKLVIGEGGIRAYFDGYDKQGTHIPGIYENHSDYGAWNGEFAAVFTPHFTSAHYSLIKGVKDDKGKKVNKVTFPASFGYLFAYVNAIKNYPEWLATAGSFRGIIPVIDEPIYEFTTAECEVLQARSTTENVEMDDPGDNIGIAINPIAYVRPFGYIVWGNRTAIYNNAEGNLKATSFLNVRNLVCSVKKVMYNAARKFTYEQNSDILWSKFKNEIIPTLDNMISGNGLVGYRFTKVQPNKKARLKARLTIVPIEAVEDFDLEIEITDSLSVNE